MGLDISPTPSNEACPRTRSARVAPKRTREARGAPGRYLYVANGILVLVSLSATPGFQLLRKCHACLDDGGILKTWIVQTKAICDLVGTVCSYIRGFDFLEIGGKDCVATNENLVLLPGARVFDKQSAIRHSD